MQEAVSLVNEPFPPLCREVGNNFDMCSIQGLITHLNMLQMRFGSQLCEPTGSCFGHQLFYNNMVSVPHFFIPQVENILATNAVHNELNVGTVILWSL